MIKIELTIPNSRLREERTTAKVMIAHNGYWETFPEEEISIVYDSSELTIVEFNGEEYPIVRQKGDKLFYKEKKYEKKDAIGLPIIFGYTAFSTFYNLQTLFNIEQLITISNLYLILVIMGLAFAWSGERMKQQIDVLYISQQLRYYTTIDPGKMPQKPLVITKTEYKGYSKTEILVAIALGFTSVAPLAFSEYIYTIDYLVSWISAGLLLMALLAKGPFSKEETRGKITMYGPGVVEAIFNENNEVKGYKNLGILVEVPGENKTEIEENKTKIEKQYKNKIIIGLDPVVNPGNALSAPERNFQTLVSEIYKDYDFTDDRYDILSANQVQELLNQRVIDKLDKDILLNIIDEITFTNDDEKNKVIEAIQNADISKTNVSEHIINTLPDETPYLTLKYIFREQDKAVRLLRNGTAYLVQENKNRAELMTADKVHIKNQTVAYNYAMTQKMEPPKDLMPHDNTFFKKSATIFGGIIGILAILVYANQNGWL